MSNAESSSLIDEQKRDPNAAFETFTKWLLIGIGSLVPAVLFLAPNIEESLSEARYLLDRQNCRQLTLALQAGPPLDRLGGRKELQRLDDQTVVVELAKIDTWGTPYRAVLTGPEHQVVRVFSCGIDQVSESSGLDFDDMSFDLAETYLDRVRQQRKQQWSITLAGWLATWACFGWGLMIHDRRGMSPPTRPRP